MLGNSDMLLYRIFSQPAAIPAFADFNNSFAPSPAVDPMPFVGAWNGQSMAAAGLSPSAAVSQVCDHCQVQHLHIPFRKICILLLL